MLTGGIRARSEGSRRAPVQAYAILITLLVLPLVGLAYYKWTGAVLSVAEAWASRDWTRTADGLIQAEAVAASMFYFSRIWIALALGILIGAAVRAFLPSQRVACCLADGGLARRHLVAAGSGVPLMLCSCCVTPIFSALYERGARLGAALTFMLASPGLNPSALVLTFILFSPQVATARLSGALLLVLLLPIVVERLNDTGVLRTDARAAPNAEENLSSPGALLTCYLRSLFRTTLSTVPLIVVGVLGSAALLQSNASIRAVDSVPLVLILSLGVVFVSLPTFFEIPLALLAVHADAPGVATAILIAGPIVNLPSLLIVGREVGRRAALVLAGGVWLTASLASVVVLSNLRK